MKDLIQIELFDLQEEFAGSITLRAVPERYSDRYVIIDTFIGKVKCEDYLFNAVKRFNKTLRKYDNFQFQLVDV